MLVKGAQGGQRSQAHQDWQCAPDAVMHDKHRQLVAVMHQAVRAHVVEHLRVLRMLHQMAV
eukprot:359980-Chlamydomonas_euryale.AAC.8